MNHRTRAIVGAVITLLLLWWVLRDVSPSEVLLELRGASPWWLSVAVLLATFSFVLRALRWRVLLDPAHEGSSFEARFGATCTGFAANNLFPARLGELIRAYVLSRVAAVPFGASIGSLVVERVLDGLVLATFLVLPILLPGFPLGGLEAAETIHRVALVASVLFAFGFVVLWATAQNPAGALRLWARTGGRLVPARFAGRLETLIETFVQGLGSLGRPSVLLQAVGWSLVVWIVLAGSMWAGLLAFDITAPGFLGAAFLQAVIGFTVAVPSTPGFFGVFEAGARIGLQPWDVADPTIVGFVTSYHILTFIPVTLMGLWYVRRVGLRWTEVRQRPVEETG